jgi:hypothetical protein
MQTADQSNSVCLASAYDFLVNSDSVIAIIAIRADVEFDHLSRKNRMGVGEVRYNPSRVEVWFFLERRFFPFHSFLLALEGDVGWNFTSQEKMTAALALPGLQRSK